ncbi:MAG: hypothetical protein ACK5LG_22050 [Bacteroides thetaiotaomicron]
MDTKNKLHYFMATVTLTIVVPPPEGSPEGTEPQICTPKVNTVVYSPVREFGVSMLGQVTTGAQLAFREKSGDPTIQIVDAIIDSIFYMGHMTPAVYSKREKAKQGG